MNNKTVVISIHMECPYDELADNLIRQMTHEELVQFIVLLDKSAQDWGPTVDLIRHFKALEEEYKSEEEWNPEGPDDLSPLKIEVE